jgi:hypothetical protein
MGFSFQDIPQLPIIEIMMEPMTMMAAQNRKSFILDPFFQLGERGSKAAGSQITPQLSQ